MGLGLAICRMIVERHHGKLAVAPAQPNGLDFLGGFARRAGRELTLQAAARATSDQRVYSLRMKAPNSSGLASSGS